MADFTKSSRLPLVMSSVALTMAFAALMMTLVNQYNDRQREAKYAEAFQTAMMPQIEDKFRTIYKDFGVEFPEGATNPQEMGAPLHELIEKMQEGTP